MKLLSIYQVIATVASLASGSILQNGQERIVDYPVTTIDPSAYQLTKYPPNATEISYKGRWESKFISWWSAPGLRFAFTGEYVAVEFGPHTIDTTLIAYRVNGQDWQFTNATTNATQLLVTPSSPNINVTTPISPATFELRVTNWAYGVQIASVSVAKDEKLIKIPDYERRLEIIGDSLSAGQYATYEGLASYAYGVGAGLGNTEYSITAYPGICMFDKLCWGNRRGMFHQWYYTSDTSGRAWDLYGNSPEPWDFSKHPAADIVVINLGTNDENAANNVTTEGYIAQYTEFIEGVHAVWPKTQIIIVSLWEGFYADGNTYQQSNVGFVTEIYEMYQYFNSPGYLEDPILYDHTTNSTYKSHSPSAPFVHYFNTTGIMQHNDIGPLWHPTDVGHVKVASHLIQYIKTKFDWVLYATGPEVQHGTLYWNDQQDY